MGDKMMIKLAMFDLDGTLFDTSMSNFYSYYDAIEKVCGHKIDKDFFLTKCYSRNYRSFLPDLGVSEDRIKEVHDLKIKLYNDHLPIIKPNEKLLHIAKLMKADGTKLAIVTTSSRANADDILSYFGYEDLFDLLVTQETVSAPKPSPDGYLYAMKYFSAAPDECLIFEDSAVGVESALPCRTGLMKILGF